MPICVGGHPLSTYTKFSEKITFAYAYQGVGNVSFLETFAYLLNGWLLVQLSLYLTLIKVSHNTDHY